MIFLSRQILLIISLMLLCVQGVEADQRRVADKSPSIYVSDQVWGQVKKYLISDNHPVKRKLDLIFSSSRVLCDRRSLEAAGFDAFPPQHRTQMIVARHPDLQGYVIKTYFDEQDYYQDKPEYYYWVRRIKGAALIRRYITTHKYGHLFKVPRKWLYLLPDEPSPPSDYLRKTFILVEEDMDIFEDQINKQLWGSEWVTKELLHALYRITTDLGLLDSAQPSNCAFSTDKKAAFVDTELYHRQRVKYEKLKPYLSPSKLAYWEEITKPKRRRHVPFR